MSAQVEALDKGVIDNPGGGGGADDEDRGVGGVDVEHFDLLKEDAPKGV